MNGANPASRSIGESASFLIPKCSLSGVPLPRTDRETSSVPPGLYTLCTARRLTGASGGLSRDPETVDAVSGCEGPTPPRMNGRPRLSGPPAAARMPAPAGRTRLWSRVRPSSVTRSMSVSFRSFSDRRLPARPLAVGGRKAFEEQREHHQTYQQRRVFEDRPHSALDPTVYSLQKLHRRSLYPCFAVTNVSVHHFRCRVCERSYKRGSCCRRTCGRLLYLSSSRDGFRPPGACRCS